MIFIFLFFFLFQWEEDLAEEASRLSLHNTAVSGSSDCGQGCARDEVNGCGSVFVGADEDDVNGDGRRNGCCGGTGSGGCGTTQRENRMPAQKVITARTTMRNLLDF